MASDGTYDARPVKLKMGPVDEKNKELWLRDADFEEIFGMTKAPRLRPPTRRNTLAAALSIACGECGSAEVLVRRPHRVRRGHRAELGAPAAGGAARSRTITGARVFRRICKRVVVSACRVWMRF